MAEGGYDLATNQRPKIPQLCRYFIHGVCDKGDNCRFVHDRTGTVPSNNVCKFYLQGRCFYGNNCRYDHIRSSQTDSGQAHSPKGRGNRLRNSPESFQTKTCSDCNHTDHDSRKTQMNTRQSHNDGRQARNGSWESSFVTLKKGSNANTDTENLSSNRKQSLGDNYKSHVFRKNWAKAKDFVPGQKFHAGASYACKAHDPDAKDEDDTSHNTPDVPKDTLEEDLMCPYHAHGDCPYGVDCNYVHGDICDICQMPRLHPTDLALREQHQNECLKEMEKDMEHSFAIQESQKKECCICLEIVLEKSDKEPEGAAQSYSKSTNHFGILENCTHCFCLDCIRRWRSDKMSFGKNVRVCPICRVHSDFVTPSNVWVEEEAAKKKVIQDYKDALRLRPCQYFKQGQGECPFNEKCFYLHAYPDGTIATPKPRPRRRRQVNSNGELNTLEAMTLWDFLEVREDGFISLEDELSLILLGMLRDSDDDSSDDDYWMFRGLNDSYSSVSSDDF